MRVMRNKKVEIPAEVLHDLIKGTETESNEALAKLEEYLPEEEVYPSKEVVDAYMRFKEWPIDHPVKRGLVKRKLRAMFDHGLVISIYEEPDEKPCYNCRIPALECADDIENGCGPCCGDCRYEYTHGELD